MLVLGQVNHFSLTQCNQSTTLTWLGHPSMGRHISAEDGE